MQHLGYTRSAHWADHALLTPDTFVRAPLPGMKNATAAVHAAPAMGARFTQYSCDLEAGGALGPVLGQRFIYVLEGELTVEISGELHRLRKDGYAYLPIAHRVEADRACRIAVIEKPYVPLDGVKQPDPVIGSERAIAGQPLMGDDALEVRTLLPVDVAFDFAVNSMTFQTGAALPMVESHVMEHGLLMLDGAGIYRLSECWYPVTAGDFIWMAPYCPQWFAALGKTPARYLLYKDWNR